MWPHSTVGADAGNNQGKQVVISKVDAPSGMGFSVRVGAELDVLISASGRTLLAFQDVETGKLRVEEASRRRPKQSDQQINVLLDAIKSRGFESIPSVQVRGSYAVAFPILDSEGRAIAALTVPYAERIDHAHRKSIAKVMIHERGHAASRLPGHAARADHRVPHMTRQLHHALGHDPLPCRAKLSIRFATVPSSIG